MRALLAFVIMLAGSRCVLDAPIAGKKCDVDNPCVAGFVCSDGTCVVPFGEGEAGGEGEGGEGEGEGGEGEGGEGEGEGGEGEGGEGEGEGEGEGDPCQPVGHDEDGDGVDDACDNCPTEANLAQSDDGEINAGAAADGVGDTCDPQPSSGGDAVALFDAFAGSTLDPAWTNTSAFTLVDDHVLHADVGSNDIMQRDDVDTTNTVVELRGTIITPAGFAGNLAVGVSMTGAGDGVICQAEHHDSGSRLHVIEIAGNSFVSGGAVDNAVGIGDPVGTPLLLRMTSAADFFCDDVGVDNVAPATPTTPAAGGVAVRVFRAEAEAESIIVYALGG